MFDLQCDLNEDDVNVLPRLFSRIPLTNYPHKKKQSTSDQSCTWKRNIGHSRAQQKCSSLNPTHLQPEAYTLLIQLQPVQQCVHTQRKKKETYPKALPFGAFERWRITDPNRLAMWPSMAIRTWKILDHFQQIHTAMLLGMFVASSVHLVDKVRCDCKAMFLPPFNLTEAWAVNFSSYPCCF